MRVISGNFRGKIINAPNTLSLRPTTDFAKTGLFNILCNRCDLEKVSALDLFSGTGNITYEFISRGTPYIVSVDSNPLCTKFIKSTFKFLSAGRAEVVCADALFFLEKNNIAFDLIFADPPFNFLHYSNLIDAALNKKNLKANGFFVLEHQNKVSFNSHPSFIEERKYGNVMFTFFKINA